MVSSWPQAPAPPGDPKRDYSQESFVVEETAAEQAARSGDLSVTTLREAYDRIAVLKRRLR